MKLKEKIEFFKYLKNLDKRMIEIDETMNLSKAADVYGECVCKMNGWPVETLGGYSYQFVEISLALVNGYRKALHDNGFCFKNGLVKPIDPDRDIPSGALKFYDERLRKKFIVEAEKALREVMIKYEPSSTENQNTIVSAFLEKIGVK